MSTRVFQQNAVLLTVSLTAVDCPSCGVVYGIPEDYRQRRMKDGQSWYCINGHSLSFHETDADRLKKELTAATERLAAETEWARQQEQALNAERKSHASTKGQLTKTRKRIQAGVCPDCNRHFENVERHMQSKHAIPLTPEPTKEETR